MDNKSIMGTITGELFQPVRLHYELFDVNGLMRAFEKLGCMKEDRSQERWTWLYDHEAKGLKFTNSYDGISKELRPIVLGSFFQRAKGTLLLDLRSCERAILAIPFFDKHIARGIAKVVRAEVANKLYSLDNPRLSPADLFDHQTSPSRDPKAEFKRLTELVTRGRGIKERLSIAMNAMQSGAAQPLSEIESIPVHYYEDGIAGFRLALRLRQIVAKEHWLGNTAYTLFDAIAATTGLK